MKPLLFIILSVLFLPVAANSQALVTADEYAIYTVLFTAVFREENESYQNISYPVIYRLTGTDEALYLGEAKRYRRLTQNFIAKNKSPAPLEQKFSLNKYYLVEEKEIEDFFAKAKERIKVIEEQAKSQNAGIIITSGNYWQPFYEKYPECYGLFRLSRAGFTTNKEFAAVQMIQETSFTGFSRTYILRKSRKGWRIISWQGSSSIT